MVAEINITYRCNIKCPNCDRGCGLGVARPDMAVDQIRTTDFTGITTASIMGGDPTLHPDLSGIVAALPIRHVLRCYSGPPKIGHYCAQDAPVDTYGPDLDYSVGCPIARNIGPGMDSSGWYPCGAGAAIAGLLGIDCAESTYAGQLRADRIQKSMLCRYCGHFARYNLGGNRWGGEQYLSPTWAKEFDRGTA